MKCAIYTRISKRKGDPLTTKKISLLENRRKKNIKISVDVGISLAEQERKLREIAKKEKYTIFKVYTDKKSGGFTNRPQYNEMIKDFENGEFQVLLVWDTDRLHRDYTDQNNFERKYTKAGMKIIYYTYYTSGFPVLTTEIVTMKKMGAEMERVFARRRMLSMFEAKMKAKEPIRQPPMGYLMDDVKKKYKYIESEAKIVYDLFDFFIQCENIGKTARWFDFSYARVKKMLQNEVYIGMLLYGEQKIKGRHKPIISESTFNRVQQIIADNKAKTKKIPKQYQI